jgi:CRP/FNR family transcriptional regulator, cyclic AMP receptor protein
MNSVTNLCDLCSGYPEQTFEAGALLLVQGEKSGRLFVLIEGTVAIRRDGIDVAAVDLPGAIFGELSLLLDKPHMASVVAQAPTRVRVIESGDAFLRSTPEVIYQVACVLAARLHMLTTYLGDLKQQFADKGEDHFVMVDAIIDCMTQHQQATETRLGSDREPGVSRRP